MFKAAGSYFKSDKNLNTLISLKSAGNPKKYGIIAIKSTNPQKLKKKATRFGEE